MLDGLRRLLGMNGNAPQKGEDEAAAMMSCDDVRSKIFEYIDLELDSDTAAAVKEHLDACPECYPRAQFEKHFVESVQRVTSQETAGPELRNRILDALSKELPEE